MNITQNKKAFFDYHIEKQYESGVMLEGWEVKSIRKNLVNIKESYVTIKGGEIFLIGCHITPLLSTSQSNTVDPVRTRKLLLNRDEINTLSIGVDRKGYTLVPIDMHMVNGRVKLKIGLAKGKQLHDKRAAEKTAEWSREKQRILRSNGT